MTDRKNTAEFISRLNYKDILIIFGSWYLILTLNFLSSHLISVSAPLLGDFLQFLFVTSGRFIYLALFIFYHISLYSISFEELGFHLKNIKRITLIILMIIVLSILVLIFINIPLSFNYRGNNFNPIYNITQPEGIVQSLFPFIFIYPFNIIIALSELLILNKVVFSLFRLKIKTIPAIILSSLFYSILLFELQPGRILINFLIALIILYLYLRYEERSLVYPALFLAGYYTIYMFYIYGWGYIRF